MQSAMLHDTALFLMLILGRGSDCRSEGIDGCHRGAAQSCSILQLVVENCVWIVPLPSHLYFCILYTYHCYSTSLHDLNPDLFESLNLNVTQRRSSRPVLHSYKHILILDLKPCLP